MRSAPIPAACGAITRMSAELPPAWGQLFPRAVRLAPDRLLVPSGTLRVLLRGGRKLPLVYTGHVLEPTLRHLQEFAVEGGRDPVPGDLALCDVDGWGDVRRVMTRQPGGTLVTIIDACPQARQEIVPESILGVVCRVGRSGDRSGRIIQAAIPGWSILAAALYRCGRVLRAPEFGLDAGPSVQRKYAQQVASYLERAASPPGPEGLALITRGLPPGGAVLVAGSGAGSEAIGLALLGYRVSGFDALPEMVGAARANALRLGAAVDFFTADLTDLDLSGRIFDLIYMTPLLYSFLPGRARRIAALERLGRHLTQSGAVIFSAHLIRQAADAFAATGAWLRRPAGVSKAEPGDWYTSFLTPQGELETSFTHLFLRGTVLREARSAGYERVEAVEAAHFVASRFRGGPHAE